MNKGDLIKAISDQSGITKAQATDALNAVVGSISGALASGEKVTLVGFGTFSVSERAARTGRNPATGMEIQIAAKKQVKFKAGKELDDSTNA
ncbi:MAG TPA: HU family DNA-binding protein [Chitinophagales bacterium]|nr:HU family DNA-binding protein [Chitinophagales bacterium]